MTISKVSAALVASMTSLAFAGCTGGIAPDRSVDSSNLANEADSRGGLVALSNNPLVSVTEYSWEIYSPPGSYTASRVQLSFPEPANCSFIAISKASNRFPNGTDDEGEPSTQLASYMTLVMPDGQSQLVLAFNLRTQGEANYVYVDQASFRPSTLRQSDDFEYELINEVTLGGFQGHLVLNDFSAPLGHDYDPARAGSIECDTAFDVSAIHYGDEVNFVDEFNAYGIAASIDGYGINRISQTQHLESSLAGLVVYPSGYGVAEVTYNDGEPEVFVGFPVDPPLEGPVETSYWPFFITKGPGKYEVSLSGVEQHSWYIVEYGMDQMLAPRSIQTDTSYFGYGDDHNSAN